MALAFQHRQVILLSAAQALFQTVSVLVMTVGGLAGGLVSSDLRLATAPIAAMFLGTALGTMPASNWMARVGRRTGFLAGAALGIAGGLIGAAGLHLGSLTILCLGTFLVGAYQGFAQFYRFAASEVADDAFRPRAISLVLAGGIVAALMGPLLGRWGGAMLAAQYAGSFVLLAVVSVLAFAVLLGVNVPQPAKVAAGEGRPLCAILAQPTYLVALFGAATGYGVMILAMTATPLAMKHYHHALDDAATVIQLHVLGMFLPSFFTGSLIARFGVLQVMLAGVLLLSTHVLTTLTGYGFSNFATALVFLGVGWNFLYVGGTALLTTTYTPAERGRAQAFNDMMIFATGLGASLGAGLMLRGLGWQTLNLVLLPWLALAGAAILWLVIRQRQTYLKA
ncbi:MAG: MFS transporter [Microcystis sp. LE19-4.1E]|nr:MFS transporter [Microcystis sp. LE19-4.1E]